MPSPSQRRTTDRPSTPALPAWAQGALLGLGMAALVMLGSHIRGLGASPLWPATPVLWGCMLRFSWLSHRWGWSGAWAGWVVALTVHDSALVSTLSLASSSLCACALGYLSMARLHPHSSGLRTPVSALHLLLACLVVAVVDGLFFAQLAPALSSSEASGLVSRSLLHGFATSLVSAVAIVPMVLALPDALVRRPTWKTPRISASLEVRLLLPAATLLVSASAAWAVQSKGAAILTLPALLWCATSYSLFATTVLTGGTGMLFMAAAAWGGHPAASTTLHDNQRLTDTLVLAVLMLAPLVVASTMASLHALEQRLRVAADFDPLTHLPVRRAFSQWGQQLLQHCALQRTPVGVLLFDVDQLHTINDTHGPDAGDLVLAAAGQLLQRRLRPQDCLGRWGGEEFAVILCNPDAHDTQRVAHRLCREFARTPILVAQGVVVHCTLSAGGVTAESAALSLPSLLSQAEQALHQAKRHGQGQWEVRPYQAIHAAPPSPPVTTPPVLSEAPRTPPTAPHRQSSPT